MLCLFFSQHVDEVAEEEKRGGGEETKSTNDLTLIHIAVETCLSFLLG